jgi:hypothetical protein
LLDQRDIYRHRAAALLSLADKTADDREATALLELVAEQLELAEAEISPQQQQQVQPKKG